MADKRSLGIPGNDMHFNWRYRSCGVDPPRKVLGMTGSVSSYEWGSRYVNSGNGTCMDAKTLSHCKPPVVMRLTRCTQTLCPSAKIMLSADADEIVPFIRRSRASQTSRLCLAGLPGCYVHTCQDCIRIGKFSFLIYDGMRPWFMTACFASFLP